MLMLSFCLFLKRSLLRTSGAWLRKCRGGPCQKQPRCPISGPQNLPPLLVSRVGADSPEIPAAPPGLVAAVQPALDLVAELGGTGGGGTGRPSRGTGWRLLPLTAEEPPDSLQ